jgi:hypothetical protein
MQCQPRHVRVNLGGHICIGVPKNLLRGPLVHAASNPQGLRRLAQRMQMDHVTESVFVLDTCLLQITPQDINPAKLRFTLYSVEGAKAEDELFVVEFVVPASETLGPYFTSGSELFVLLDGVNQKLTAP